MIENLFIYCSGGFGRETLELARVINAQCKMWENISFVDDAREKKEINGAKIYAYDEIHSFLDKEKVEFIIANGEPMIKKKICEKLIMDGYQMTNLIHPSIHYSRFNQMGIGNILCEGSILTTNITIGNCVIININTTIGHDVIIGNHTTLSPSCNISGGVKIGNDVYIGSGVTIRDELSIGNHSIIGIGSLVTKNIPENKIAFGSPITKMYENNGCPIFK
ncbi:MAG: acetyltransferase [Eubacterium sp.]